jgi:hypothetical protein
MLTPRLLVCYLLIPGLFALLNILRGTVYAPTLPYWDRVLVFLPPALSGWIIAGVLIAGIIELTGARSVLPTVASTAVGAVLAATFDYYSLGSYYYLMRDRWPWLRPFYDGNVPIFKDPLPHFLICPSSIYFYATIAITYAGYRALVPGARYLGDKGTVAVGSTPAVLNQNGAGSQPDTDDATQGRGVSPFLRRLPPQLGGELILLSAEEHYVRVVTRLGSALVLCRLSDAVDELTNIDGDRVHRSFWVAWREVVKVQRQGRSFRLKMSSGEEVPVSRSQIGVVSRRLSRHNADGRSSAPAVAPVTPEIA